MNNELKKMLELHEKWVSDQAGGVRADLNGADLSDASLRGACLIDAGLSSADLNGADLSDASLRGACLIDADLSSADLRGARLSNADLSDVNLLGADLSGADLRGACLRDADLSGADLRGARLRNADLSDANLLGADLSGADLRGACLRGCAGNLTHIRSVWIELYQVTYTADVMQIGCQRHEINQWWEFSDQQIIAMDGRRALEWWAKYKPLLQQIIAVAPAEPTGYIEGGAK